MFVKNPVGAYVDIQGFGLVFYLHRNLSRLSVVTPDIYSVEKLTPKVICTLAYGT
jgi:hypothetical protein